MRLQYQLLVIRMIVARNSKVQLHGVGIRDITRVVNIGSGIGTDSIADSDTQYRISIGGTLKKRVPEGYRGGIDRYSDTDTSSVIIVCHYSLSYNKK